MSASWTVARTLCAPRDVVWEWLQAPSHIFSLNVLHVRVDCDDARLGRDTVARVLHRMGFKTEDRVLRVQSIEPYRVTWSDLFEDGTDFFPHAQQLRLTLVDEGSCRVENRLSGRFVVPRLLAWSVPLYGLLGPQILHAELRKLERLVLRAQG